MNNAFSILFAAVLGLLLGHFGWKPVVPLPALAVAHHIQHPRRLGLKVHAITGQHVQLALVELEFPAVDGLR